MAELKRAFSTFNFYDVLKGLMPKNVMDRIQSYWDLHSIDRLSNAENTMNDLWTTVYKELMFAWEKYGHLNSAHEGYAILLEEVDELWEHVKMKQSERNMDEMGKEVMQVIAMAVKFYVDIIAENNKR